jgi:hypothetical protein
MAMPTNVIPKKDRATRSVLRDAFDRIKGVSDDRDKLRRAFLALKGCNDLSMKHAFGVWKLWLHREWFFDAEKKLRNAANACNSAPLAQRPQDRATRRLLREAFDAIKAKDPRPKSMRNAFTAIKGVQNDELRKAFDIWKLASMRSRLIHDADRCMKIPGLKPLNEKQ